MPSRWKLFEPDVPPALRGDVLHVRVFENYDPAPFSVKVAPVALPGMGLHHRGDGAAISAIETLRGTVRRLPLAFVYGRALPQAPCATGADRTLRSRSF